MAVAWSAAEQSRVATAVDRTRDALAAVNRDYEAKFGYIYIVCAAGKAPEELLAIARRRLTNEPSASSGSPPVSSIRSLVFVCARY